MTDTRVIILEQNALAFVEAWATYGDIKDVAEPVVLKLRVVGMRKPDGDRWPLDAGGGKAKPYVAHLEPCLRDECRDGLLRQCDKPNGHLTVTDAWLKHIKTYCHGWHEASVRRFMREVLDTYGAKPKPATKTVGVSLSHYRERSYADVGGMSALQQARLLDKVRTEASAA